MAITTTLLTSPGLSALGEKWMGVMCWSISVTVLALLLWSGSHILSSPLRRFPGPVIAAWTNIWRFWAVWGGSYHLRMKKLHDQHGPVVRIGPNTLSLNTPELVKTIYGTDGRWLKTDFYENNSAVVNGEIVHNLFSISDPVAHAQLKRPVAKYYTPAAVLAIEPLIDSTIRDLCSHLETRFMDHTGGIQACDLGRWLAYCAWDMVGTATFSKNFRYMDMGADHDKTIEITDKSMNYFAIVGQIPFLDSLLDKNPIFRMGPPNLANITRIAIDHIMARLQGNDRDFDPAVPDYLDRYLKTQAEKPGAVHSVLNYSLITLLAGADTTAITTRAVLYFLMKDRRVKDKLEKEIAAAGADCDDVTMYASAKTLPYLEAVVRESMRMHPAVCMPLERYVPEDGLTLPDGSFVPPGTAVGINPYIMGRNKAVWGADADVFRPERWLQATDKGESEGAFRERMRRFQAADLTFGGGSRTCLGRHFGIIMVYKLVATLVSRYDMELTNPTREWSVQGIWAARQSGLVCNLRKRQL